MQPALAELQLLRGLLADMLNEFYDNGGTVWKVFSKGAVTLSNLDAYANTGGGVYVRNDYGTVEKCYRQYHLCWELV
jgi:hypothetical protein